MIWVLYLVGLILIGCSDQRLVGEDALTSAPTPTAVASVVILEPTPAVNITPTNAPAGEITPTSTPDGDGWSVAEGDCDDLNWLIHPDVPEACDGVDQNCNGQVDEGTIYYAFNDNDLDGLPVSPLIWSGCTPDWETLASQDVEWIYTRWPAYWDCDDSDPNIRGEPCPPSL